MASSDSQTLPVPRDILDAWTAVLQRRWREPEARAAAIDGCVAASAAMSTWGMLSDEIRQATTDLVVASLDDEDLEVRRRAVKAFESLLADGSHPHPRLLEVLLSDRHPLVRCAVAEVLVFAVPTSDVVDALCSAAASNAAERDDALVTVACLVANHTNAARAFADKIVPVLVGAATSNNPDRAYAACRALEAYGDDSTEVVSVLIALLDDKDVQMRRLAIKAFEPILKRGAPPHPRLLAALNGDPHPGVRLSVAEVLVHARPTAAMLDGLCCAAADDRIDVRKAAVNTLGFMVANHARETEMSADKIVQALVRAASEDDTDLVCSACMGLGSFGCRAIKAVPVLLELLPHADEQVRYQATLALSEIAPRMALPELVAMLHRHGPDGPDPHRPRWRVALNAIEEAGFDAQAAVADLVELREKTADEEFRVAVSSTLEAIGARPELRSRL